MVDTQDLKHSVFEDIPVGDQGPHAWRGNALFRSCSYPDFRLSELLGGCGGTGTGLEHLSRYIKEHFQGSKVSFPGTGSGDNQGLGAGKWLSQSTYSESWPPTVIQFKLGGLLDQQMWGWYSPRLPGKNEPGLPSPVAPIPCHRQL